MESTHDEQPGQYGMTTPEVDAGQAPDVPETAGAAEQPAATNGESSISATAANVAHKLKPVAEAAESLAGQAVNLSARGLNWLDATLTERRRQRAADGEAAPESLPPGTDTRGDDAPI